MRAQLKVRKVIALHPMVQNLTLSSLLSFRKRGNDALTSNTEPVEEPFVEKLTILINEISQENLLKRCLYVNTVSMKIEFYWKCRHLFEMKKSTLIVKDKTI